jgi:hypothetical protein
MDKSNPAGKTQAGLLAFIPCQFEREPTARPEIAIDDGGDHSACPRQLGVPLLRRPLTQNPKRLGGDWYCGIGSNMRCKIEYSLHLGRFRTNSRTASCGTHEQNRLGSNCESSAFDNSLIIP